MSGNSFTGVIPQEFGGMTLLKSLDLSQNQLSDDIPEALTNLSFLGILKLSNNQLVGRIPQSGQFPTFQNSSFEGNLGLCGLPLSNPCSVSPAPSSPVHVDDLSHVDVILFLFIGLGFGVGFAAAILALFDHGREETIFVIQRCVLAAHRWLTRLNCPPAKRQCLVGLANSAAFPSRCFIAVNDEVESKQCYWSSYR
uniref:Uncharacterized protein n=1 Tax=Avena sativa TaxID=4498 RepID=A0ACD5VDK0_AVESA